jgi:hypothetical protein
MASTHKHSTTIPRRLLMLAGLLVSNLLFAQKSPFSVAFTGGVSFPTGKFAAKDFRVRNAAPNENGAARPGLNANLQIDARISSKLFITLTGGLSKYHRDTDKAVEAYRMLYGNPNITVESQRWEVYKLLLGPSLHLPLGNKLTFRSGIAAGLASTSVPSYTTTQYDANGQQTMKTTWAYDNLDLATAFAYQINAGAGYKIGQQLSLVLDVNYFGAKTSGIQTIYPVVTGMGDPAPYTLHHKYPLNAITALVGLEWQF